MLELRLVTVRVVGAEEKAVGTEGVARADHGIRGTGHNRNVLRHQAGVVVPAIGAERGSSTVDPSRALETRYPEGLPRLSPRCQHNPARPMAPHRMAG